MSNRKSTSTTPAEASGDGEYVKLELVSKASPSAERRAEEGELLKSVLQVGRIEARQQLEELLRKVKVRSAETQNKHTRCVQYFDKAVEKQCRTWAENDPDLKRVAAAMGKLIDAPVDSTHLIRHISAGGVEGRVLKLHVNLAFAIPFVSASREDAAFDDCSMSDGCRLAYADATKLAGCEELTLSLKMDADTFARHEESLELSAELDKLGAEEEELKARLKSVDSNMQALEAKVIRQQISAVAKGDEALKAMDQAVSALVSGKGYLNLMG